jgi:Tol biopolymer transport system component
VKAGFGAAFAAPDVLLYIRDSALVAQRFSLADVKLLGEPRVVVEGLALEAIPGGASFSASTSGAIGYRSRSRDLASELRWIARDGRVEPPSASASDITVSLSPDGRMAAVTRVLTTSSREDRFPSNVWLFDVRRRVSSRFTLDANATDENPIWSADGAAIAFATHREGGLAEVYVQPAARAGAARVVASGPENFHPIDWWRNGTLLLHAYATGGGSDDIDMWTLGSEPGAKPRPFIVEPGNQAQGQFSPDGRWVAYTSDESGRLQVYVRAFPSGDPRVQISSDGGGQPRWSADGREIFYVSLTGTVMAVPLTLADQPTAGVPVPLFTEASLQGSNNVFFYGGAAAYDVTADGRFMVSRLTVAPSAGPIHLVLNGLRNVR